VSGVSRKGIASDPANKRVRRTKVVELACERNERAVAELSPLQSQVSECEKVQAAQKGLEGRVEELTREIEALKGALEVAKKESVDGKELLQQSEIETGKLQEALERRTGELDAVKRTVEALERQLRDSNAGSASERVESERTKAVCQKDLDAAREEAAKTREELATRNADPFGSKITLARYQPLVDSFLFLSMSSLSATKALPQSS
jgi:chromosome segregation ATPase